MVPGKRLIVIGVITFLAGVIVLFPARVAYQAFAPDSVRLSGIDGSIWNGSAIEGQVGRLYIRNIRWSFKPWHLFTGNLAFATGFEPAGGFMEAGIALGIGGSIRLTDLEGAVSIAALRDVLPAPGMPDRRRPASDSRSS